MASAPFKKILIANRGEIALRVICACKELGIGTVAVYSEADRDSLHVRFADQAICIGPAKSAKSYLDIPSVISAAEITNCEAIHPGYGFLSENAGFAEVCEVSGIKFIGPTPAVIRAMGVKDCARGIMRDAGVPILPGSDGVLGSAEEAIETAGGIGYPVIVKASAGGGGRGMRIVRRDSEMPGLFAQAQQEAGASFSSSDVYLEKFIEAPRHIEFQVLADEHGNVEILGERECSIQRRHQKLIEESPSPKVVKELRDRISNQLRVAMKTVGYTNAGTVEFLVDDGGNFYFLEVNKRIQVEHTITEEVTGIDLVKQQILIAMGEPLHLSEKDIHFKGHAIECRINAEDPFDDFRPCPGRIEMYYAPGGLGVRIDSHVYAGYTIPSHYDSMIGKLITHGRDRREAMDKMSRALGEYMITGIKTTIPFEQAILQDPNFRRGVYSTNFLDHLLGGARRELIEEKA